MTYNRPNYVPLPPEYDKKAKNIYTRMSLYFDLNIYKEPRNDTLLYQYLYHIIYMLACRKKFFVSWDDYDKFAIYMATKIYLRYISPKHQEEEDKLKSVLNYCKSLLYPTKVDFLKENYAEIIGSDPKSDNDFSILRDSMIEGVQSDHRNNELILNEIIGEFEFLPKLIWKEVKKTPYTTDTVFTHRLFMSVLLTVAKGVTLSNQAISKIQKRLARGLDIDDFMLTSLMKERESSVTLWRLDNKYYNLINLLAFKVRKKCGENVGLIRQDYELSSEDVTAVLMSAYGNVARDDNEEF